MASMLPPSFSASVDNVTRYIYAVIALMIAVQLIAIFIAYVFAAESKSSRMLIFKITNGVGLVIIALYLLSTVN